MAPGAPAVLAIRNGRYPKSARWQAETEQGDSCEDSEELEKEQPQARPGDDAAPEAAAEADSSGENPQEDSGESSSVCARPLHTHAPCLDLCPAIVCFFASALRFGSPRLAGEEAREKKVLRFVQYWSEFLSDVTADNVKAASRKVLRKGDDLPDLEA